MKELAKGISSDCIYKLLKVTIDTQQQIYLEARENMDEIDDIADKIETDRALFADEEPLPSISEQN